MSYKWRMRFLTWGIAIAVFGMRFVFPIVIVAIFSNISCMEVLRLTLEKPDDYAKLLHESHVGISSFGGAFLMMLFCEFMFDREKSLHWLSMPEKLLQKSAGAGSRRPSLRLRRSGRYSRCFLGGSTGFQLSQG